MKSFLKAGQSASVLILTLLACLVGAPKAHANTYQFSITANQLMTDIGDSYVNDGFFAFWFQVESPNGVNGCNNVNGCTIASVQETVQQNPNPTGDPWTQSTYFTDPSDSTYSTGTGVWVEFSKQNNQQNVSLAQVSGSTSLNSCTSLTGTGCQYADSGTYPVYFGGYNGGNSDVNNAFDYGTFQFSLNTAAALSTSSSYTLLVVASEINPGGSAWPSPPFNNGAKTSSNQAFSFSIGAPTLTAVPEPAHGRPWRQGWAC